MKLAATMNKPDLSLDMEQTNLQKNKSLAKYKLTVVFAIAVAIVTAIVIVVLVYFAFVKRAPMQHDFHIIRITAKDGEKDKKVDLEYKVDRSQKMALFSFQDNDGQQILGYRDFQKGVEAFRMIDDNTCIVAKLLIDDDDKDEDDDNETNHPIFESQVVSINSSHKFVVLNETIYPTMQQLAVGERVSSFCGNLRTLWMLPEEEVARSNLPNVHGRKRRAIITVGGHAHAVATPSRFSGNGNRNRCTYSCYGSRWGRCYRRCY